MSHWQTGNSNNEQLNFVELADNAVSFMRLAGLTVGTDSWARGEGWPTVTVFAEANPDVLYVRVWCRPAKNLVPMYGLMVRHWRQDVDDHPNGIHGCVIDAANYLARTPWRSFVEGERTPAVDYQDTTYKTPKGGV